MDENVKDSLDALECECDYGEQQGQHKVAVDVFDLRKAITALRQMKQRNSCDICGGCESMTYTVNCIRGSGIELRYKTHRGKEAHYCPNCGKLVKHDG